MERRGTSQNKLEEVETSQKQLQKSEAKKKKLLLDGRSMTLIVIQWF